MSVKVIFSDIFNPSYGGDLAADDGRMEAVAGAIEDLADYLEPDFAPVEDILSVHDPEHVDRVRRKGLYEIASLAAGGAILTAQTGLTEPAFGLIRPPGHHAWANYFHGYCYFNNMAIAMTRLKKDKLIESCFILDIDLHYSDGTVDILGDKFWAAIYNPVSQSREKYLEEVESILARVNVDIIGVSAGFDSHEKDWSGPLKTEDFNRIAGWVAKAAKRCGAGFFGLLEGGYNRKVLGASVAAFLEGWE